MGILKEMGQYSVLVVDSAAQTVRLIKRRLEAEGFHVVSASSGVEALDIFAAIKLDLVVLDLLIPGLDGLTLCRRIRERSEAPLLVLSSKSEEADVVSALEVGADDYLVKPFRLGELVARIRALLRRPQLAPLYRPSGADELRAGRVALFPKTHEVRVDGVPVSLTPTEFRMLVFLMKHADRVVSRDVLLEAIWGYTGYDESLINTHIKRLRAKIEQNPNRPQVILTVRGFGYKLVDRAVVSGQ
jgi:two-component system, OmpR family, response regulator MtrA